MVDSTGGATFRPLAGVPSGRVSTPPPSRQVIVRIATGAPELSAALEQFGLSVTTGTPSHIDGAHCWLADGIPDGIRDLLTERAGATVLCLVDNADRRRVTALLDAGASGVALRSDAPHNLARAIEAVAAGYLVIPGSSRQALRRPVFTVRQKQILAMVVLGLSNRDIAQRLFISQATVKMHLTGAFAMLGVTSRKEAVDVILDPASGLGTGVLELPAGASPQEGYGAPRIR